MMIMMTIVTTLVSTVLVLGRGSALRTPDQCSGAMCGQGSGEECSRKGHVGCLPRLARPLLSRVPEHHWDAVEELELGYHIPGTT